MKSLSTLKLLYWILPVMLLAGCSEEGEDQDPGPVVNLVSPINENDRNFVFFQNGEQQFYFPIKKDLPGFSNRYLEISEQLNINMSADGIIGGRLYACDIYLSVSDLFGITVPARIGESPTLVGSGELQLLDELADVETQFGSDDDFNFAGSSIFGQMSFNIVSVADQVIQAEFDGVIQTKTGRSINVENGLLRIELENED